MNCPACGHENPGDAAFCGECAASLAPESAAQSDDAAAEESRRPGRVAKLFGWARSQARGLTVGMLISGLWVNYCTERDFQRPDAQVEGVLPIIVHDEWEGPPISEDGVPTLWPDNRLVFVFKLQNNGPTPSRLGVGLITGCASVPLDMAGHLFGQEMDGRNINEIYQEAEAKWGKARQKIATTGSTRELYEVAAFSLGYVAIEISLPI